MLCKKNKYCPKNEERISAYSSGNFGKIGKNWTSLDFEIQALINSLEKFKIYLNNEFTVRTDCGFHKEFLKLQINLNKTK